jgi:phytoene synthase
MEQHAQQPSRAAIVATARESIARGSRSFASASRLFARSTRERAWLLYAWCRRCDDLADGQEHGHDAMPVIDGGARLEAIRRCTEAALDGDVIGDPPFDALRIVVAETRMPRRFVEDLLEGFALDAAGWQPESEAELLGYCYHVAGTVGCMMAVAMGVDPDDDPTLDRACDLGIAFQLANIARDIAEDEAAGRCYLPADWRAEGLSRAELALRLAERAEAYVASARGGTRALPLRSAWAVLAAANIYGDIARRVVAQGDRAWDRRVTVPAFARLAWIARAAIEAYRRRSLFPGTSRTGLWTRPRS